MDADRKMYGAFKMIENEEIGLGKTHIKKVFFSGRTTKRGGGKTP